MNRSDVPENDEAEYVPHRRGDEPAHHFKSMCFFAMFPTGVGMNRKY